MTGRPDVFRTYTHSSGAQVTVTTYRDCLQAGAPIAYAVHGRIRYVVTPGGPRSYDHTGWWDVCGPDGYVGTYGSRDTALLKAVDLSCTSPK